MLTRYEAALRACRIWPGQEIAVTPMSWSDGDWWINVAGDARAHLLDGNGHATCHPECSKASYAVTNKGNNILDSGKSKRS